VNGGDSGTAWWSDDTSAATTSDQRSVTRAHALMHLGGADSREDGQGAPTPRPPGGILSLALAAGLSRDWAKTKTGPSRAEQS